MKKISVMLLGTISVITLWTGTAFALDAVSSATPVATVSPAAITSPATITSPAAITSPATITSPDAITSPTAITSPAAIVQPDTSITIAPDNILYTVKRLIEGLQIALTFTPEGKAELLVTLADKRLAEANLMSEDNKKELVEQVMKTYVVTVKAANEKLEEATQNGKDMTAVLDDIRIIELTADKLVIKATGQLPAESAETLKTQVADQVKSTLAVQAFSIAKSDFKNSTMAVKAADEDVKAAEKAGDDAAVKAAQSKLDLALKAKTDAENLKNEVEAYKNDIVKNVDDENKDEDHQLNQQELQKKIAKMEEIIAKQQAKSEMQIEKHKDKPGKASEKMEEHAKTQLAKKQAKLDELKALLAASQTSATTGQAISPAGVKVVVTDSSAKVISDDKDSEDEDKDEGKDNEKDHENNSHKDKGQGWGNEGNEED